MPTLRTLLLTLLSLPVAGAAASEADIRRNLFARLPDLPAIEAIRPGPMAGLWEVQIGGEVIYSDATGALVFEGDVIDTGSQRNLTTLREAALQAFDVQRLPWQDAVVWKRGKGSRRLVVFADPNCGFCRQLERTLSDFDDIAVYTFLIPILGEDSEAKARAIWCSREPGAAWRRWMVDGKAPPEPRAGCDVSALSRNLALQRRHGVQGTPTMVFSGGHRVAGVLSAAALNERLSAQSRKPR